MPITAKFAGTCTACGCRFPIGTSVEWVRGRGARHAAPEQCKAEMEKKATERAAKDREAPILELKAIADFLKSAQERGLKRPKLRVLALDGKSELRISITTRGQAPGSVAVVEAGTYLGGVRPNGMVVGTMVSNRPLQDYLLRVARDPIHAAKEYAALMGLCSFCGKPLTDAGSVEVGYGPVCAKHWGLPHSPRGVPSVQIVPDGR